MAKDSDQTVQFYVDLPAIIGGTILALAVSIVFVQFGSAIGLAATSELRWQGDTAVAGVVATGLWVLWTQIIASLTGGYLAGRMRRPAPGAALHEREVRDGAHGLLVWAAGTVLVAVGTALASAFAALAAEPGSPAAQQAQDIVDLQRNGAIVFAFVAAATSLVSAVAAWWAATLGGEHRDESPDHSRYFSFRRN